MSVLKIVNIGPIKKAEIEIDHKITVVAGKNGSGKSTIAKLLGMLQSGQDFGFFSPSGDRVLKKDSDSLLYNGSKEGSAFFGNAVFVVKRGGYSLASDMAVFPIVCGQERWSTMAISRRDMVLDAVFGINPTNDELRELLRNEGATDSGLDVVEIDRMLTGLRQEWTARTGEKRYPEATAEAWLPLGGFPEDALLMDLKLIQKGATLARDEFLAVKDVGWIDEEEIARLRSVIATPTPGLAEIEKAGKENQAQAEKTASNAPIAPQQRPSKQIPLPPQPVPPTPVARKESKCTHCGTVLGCGCEEEQADTANRERLAENAQSRYARLLAQHQEEMAKINAHNDKIVAWTTKYQADMAEWGADMKAHNKKMADFASRQSEIRQQYRDVKNVVDAQLAAKNRLEKMQPGVSKEQYRTMEDAKIQTERLLSAATAYQGALAIHGKIEGLKLAKKLLLDNGLKGEKKRAAINSINEATFVLAEGVEGSFGVSNSLDVRHITTDGDTHTLLSTGMTLVCDWLIQLVIGQISGGIVVIDGLDMLKAPFSNLMMRAINQASCQVLVTYTDNKRLVQENFDGLDSSMAFYRVEDGETALEWELSHN